NIKLMQEKGFKLSAEDIYSINKACMKDAVLSFGGGCTGEIISGEGLLITNHHCGRSLIQRHSSLDHDYIANGFWAMSRQEELPNPGLTVTILKRMEDVTDKVLNGVTDQMSSAERDKIIQANADILMAEAVKGTGYRASVRPFYMGNQYFLFVNEIFRDIRMVGAPPAAIGNFGSETDNWIWPRHTGDFSLFRIYSDKDNKPSDYSADNVPYKPAFFFPISLKGVKEGDFTMVFGYPGQTYEYVPSYYIDMIKNYINPKIIDIRTRKISIMEEEMAKDPLVRIQYYAKKSGIANSWKKWQGEILGLNKMNTIAEKQKYEEGFTKWVNTGDAAKAKYGQILPSYEKVYASLKDYLLVNSYTSEVTGGAEAFRFASSLKTLSDLVEGHAPEEAVRQAKEGLAASAPSLFKDYNVQTDKRLFVAVMQMYGNNLEEKWLAPAYISYRIETKGNFTAAAEKLFAKSPFCDEKRFTEFVQGFNKSSVGKLKKDKFYILARSMTDFISQNVAGELARLNSEAQNLNRLYMAAQMEYERGKMFYPDANSTLRVAYGNVAGYKSRDAVNFECITTLEGIMEKDNPEVFDYDVPDKLKELYKNKDYGRYAVNGKIPICFIANNHTTGGNSGSPVINADGHLIGVNFDRAWEGVASDMDFNPEQSRNISLDIRYALFIIDKFAGAGYLLNEMKLIE
ncbi:MAG: S46 family peptidase, partial [Chloroflexota bacterium]